MKKFIIFSVLLFYTFFVKAQYNFPDSIKTVKEKTNYLNEIAKNSSKIDSSIFYSEKALEYAKKSNNDSILSATHYNIANYTYAKGLYNESIKLFNEALSFSESKNIKYYIFRNHSKIAKAYMMNGKENLGLEHYNKALNITLKLKDSLLIGDAYNNLGDAYKTLDLDDQAKKYFLLALKIYDLAKVDESEKVITYKNLSRIAKTIDETKSYLEKAEKIILAENNTQKTTLFYLTKADALYRKEYYSEAINAAQKSFDFAKIINFKTVEYLALTVLGRSHSQLNRNNKAKYFLEKAIKYKKINQQNKFIILKALVEVYNKQKEYKSANDASHKMLNLMDSISIFKAKEKFAEFDAKFKTAEKDKEIAKQQLEITKQKNNTNKLIFGGLILLLIIYSFFQWFYSKQKRKKLITENKLQKELEINELRTKFLGNIAHEIRTPLTLIAGNLELAKENINTKEKAIQNIDVALTNSKKVVEDANEILELLKFEKSKITIKSNVVNLETTLKRIFFSFKSLAELKNVDLEYQSVIRTNFQTKIDVEKVEKILNNLISNALKYSPSNSKIIFNTNIKSDNLVVSVTDFGQGIHFNETEKIFQRFYQASNSQSVGGIGIGLSLAKEFAELLKGNLSVESEITKGSTFTFSLPITEITTKNINSEKDLSLIHRKSETNKKTMEKAQQIPKQVQNDCTKKSHILIVEDNPEMNNYLVEILSKKYNCSTAFDGLEALEKMKNTNFDLITSDIMMPNLDGFQFREKINEVNEFKNIPFILISAKTLTEDKIKGFQLGIDDYVIKPFNKNELIARIDNLLLHKEAREKWTLDNKTLISSEESSDKKLLKKIETIVLENISNENFKIDDLAKAVGYSQRQLTRILKQYSGMSPVKFILEIRLQKAYVNLQNRTFFSLSEIRYDVGITSASYFNKKFKERFGLMPNDLLN